MPDGVITATDANRQFSKLLRVVEDGGRVTITKDGRPVAMLVPAEARQTAVASSVLDRFDALTERGLPMDFRGGLDREALHRR